MRKVLCDHCGVDTDDVASYTLQGNEVAPQDLCSLHVRDLCAACFKKVKDAFYGSVGN
jgi:hypothetical protein